MSLADDLEQHTYNECNECEVSNTDNVLDVYLPPPKLMDDPITWFEANSDDDCDGPIDFTSHLLGGGDKKTKKSEKSEKLDTLTLPMSYGVVMPGVFSFLATSSAVAFDTILLIPAALAVILLVAELVAIWKITNEKWYMSRLMIYAVISMGLFSLTGGLAGHQIDLVREAYARKVFNNVNPANEPVGKGIYHFMNTSHIGEFNVFKYTLRADPGYDKTKLKSCLAPIINLPIANGHTVSYYAVQSGKCCEGPLDTKCWASVGWTGMYAAPASAANGIKAFAKEHKLIVPEDAIILSALPNNFMTVLYKYLAIYTGVPFVLIGLMPFFGIKRKSNDAKYEKMDDPGTRTSKKSMSGI